MPHDLVIRGGNVVDGTAPNRSPAMSPWTAQPSRRSARSDDRGDREIDAEGHAVTPGFVDLHTHFDAQAGWDPLLTPVSWHGVTTALFGNCGVTFAPCKPADREFLAGMMRRWRTFQKDAILGGLPWDWESYGSTSTPLKSSTPRSTSRGWWAHCASRFYVMGERAITDDATEDEIRQIASLVGQSVKEGAIGFSTNRLPGHVLPDGRSIPGDVC